MGLACFAATTQLAQAQAPDIETIILKGEPAPGAGTDFLASSTFDPPVLNEAGQFCFTAKTFLTNGMHYTNGLG